MKRFYLYNTLSRRKERVKPLFPPQVRIYTCGPTVYAPTHLGHMRTYTNTDLLVRTLSFLGYRPYQVMNITDVGHLLGDGSVGEDKVEKAARKEKKTAWEIARQYEKEFFQVLRQLNIRQPDVSPRATENIAEMIALVSWLEKKGFTYRTPDGIYFDTSKVKDYGKLAHLSLENLRAGARVEVNPHKKHPADFALWKFTPPGVKRQMEWASPWAKHSFPGWHIECSTMAMKYLSPCFKKGKFFPQKFETIDIHTGGVDHIPVHHTNEIAQSEAATGKKFVNYWMHNEFLEVEGEKMSKSKGNFYSLKDLQERGVNDLAPLRYLFLSAHYRKKMNFTWSALEASQQSYQRLLETLAKMRASSSQRTPLGEKKIMALFEGALADDLNVPRALAIFHQMLKEKSLSPFSRWLLAIKMDRVLGLGLKEKVKEKTVPLAVPKAVRLLVKKREILRREKKWSEADKIRQQIEKQGFILEDTPQGTKIISKEK